MSSTQAWVVRWNKNDDDMSLLIRSLGYVQFAYGTVIRV